MTNLLMAKRKQWIYTEKNISYNSINTWQLQKADYESSFDDNAAVYEV